MYMHVSTGSSLRERKPIYQEGKIVQVVQRLAKVTGLSEKCVRDVHNKFVYLMMAVFSPK